MSARIYYALAVAAVVALGCAPESVPIDEADHRHAHRPGDAAPIDAAPVAGSTQAMIDRLREHRESLDHRTDIYSPERAVAFYDQIEPPPDLRSRTLLRARRARALLYAGRTEEALAELDAVAEVFATSPELFKDRFVRQIAELRAIAHLRRGEDLNCVDGHAAEACLVPLRGGGVHQQNEPARRAMAAYAALLEETPDDPGDRWLLNLAAMAAGVWSPDAWPDDLDPSWRIDESALESETSFPHFRNVALEAGVATFGLAGSVVADDLDGDGRTDLLVSSWGAGDPLRAYRGLPCERLGTGCFEPYDHGLGSQRDSSSGGLGGGLNLIHADFDNDGDLDVYVLRGAWLGQDTGAQPNSLLRNRGDGTFDDVTEAAGLLDAFPTQTAAWGDYDLDGHLDLAVGAESSPGGRRVPSRLYRNRGDGTFEEVGAQVGADVVSFTKAVSWGDFDADGDPDLYLSTLAGPNRLLRNDLDPATGQRSFVDVAPEAGVTEPRHGFGVAWLDANQDGHLDLFVGGYALSFQEANVDDAAADLLGLPNDGATSRLYLNQRDGTFEDATEAWGLDRVVLPMALNVGDLDADGYPDLYLGTGAPDFSVLVPNKLYKNDRGRRFVDVTTAAGLGHLQKGHGIAFADFDEDGDLDIYTVLGGAYSGDVYPNALFENSLDEPGLSGGDDSPTAGASTLTLDPRSYRRLVHGARVRVAVDSPSGPREVFETINGGGSFGSSSLRRTLGLGDAIAVREIEITWPDGEQQILPVPPHLTPSQEGDE